MLDVLMYSSNFCPFCIRANQLLRSKGIRVTELLVDGNPTLRQQMMQKSGRRTVPQIWVGDTHIGGCDDLFALERAGQFDTLVQYSG